jgi:hypothetical protein
VISTNGSTAASPPLLTARNGRLADWLKHTAHFPLPETLQLLRHSSRAKQQH